MSPIDVKIVKRDFELRQSLFSIAVESLFSKMINASKNVKFQQFINSNGKTKIDSSDSMSNRQLK